MITYLESSAAVKLLLDEAESDALVAYLNSYVVEGRGAVVSSAILETELRRAAVREDVAQDRATAILDRLNVFDLDRSLFTSAGILPGPHLRSLDALHIAAALKADADVMISYDARQIAAAESVGLRTISPA